MNDYMAELFGESINRSRLLSEEVYYGGKHPFHVEVVNIISELRTELKNIVLNNGVSSGKDTINSDKFMKINSRLEKTIAKYTNVETCSIAWSNFFNANTSPIIYDPALLYTRTKEVYNKYGYLINDKYLKNLIEYDKDVKKLNYITIDNKGIRFNESKGKLMIINLGLDLFTDIVNVEFYNKNAIGLTDEDIGEIIFHEIGHNFQHALNGIKQNLVNVYGQQYISRTVDVTSNFIRALSILMAAGNLKVLKFLRMDPSSKYKASYETRTKLSMNILLSLVSLAQNEKGSFDIFTRENIAKYYKDLNAKSIDILYKRLNSAEGKVLVFMIYAAMFILDSLMKVIGLVFIPFDLLFKSLSKSLYDKYAKSLVDRSKSNEQFADYFAIAYGFDGSNFSEVVTTMMKTNGSKFKYSPLNYVPFLSTGLALNNYNAEVLRVNSYGYDTMSGRVGNAYVQLQHELNTNKSLTQSQRSEIVAHMNNMKSKYDISLNNELSGLQCTILGKLISNNIIKSKEISNSGKDNNLKENVLDIVDEIVTKYNGDVASYVDFMYGDKGTTKEKSVVKKFLLSDEYSFKNVISLLTNIEFDYVGDKSSDVHKRIMNLQKSMFNSIKHAGTSILKIFKIK